jgi:D-alanyl-D-alanine carboxypeptidase/D-alanyl-D-alanine-endopeptidase (penicillin-binding protein 4)
MKRSTSLIFFQVGVVYCCIVVFGQVASAACPSFSKLIRHGAFAVSEINGKIISGCNVDTSFIPASILKIPTALAAFSILGPAYRFKTYLYTDRHNNLYIKGFGDPLLVTEEIELIFTALKLRSVEQINAIYIDNSSFALEHQVPGRELSANPYDAPVGAVSVNFNSVPVRVTRKRHIVSGEKQTPDLPLMQELAQKYRPGRYRINICQEGCNPDAQMARYTIELFRAIQKKNGIAGQGESGIKQVPVDAHLLYAHFSSKNLENMASSMLKYSSNFIANLVYLTCGAEQFGYPATWEKAHKAVDQALIRQLGEKTVKAIIHEEGAGLSRRNRISARTMLAVLKTFEPYAYLLRKKQGCLTKSGSMKGIYNFAGYLPDGKPYVIMLNQLRNTRKSLLKRLRNGQYPQILQ